MSVQLVTTPDLAPTLRAAGLSVRDLPWPAHVTSGDAVLVLDARHAGSTLPLHLVFALPLAAPPSLATADACVPIDADADVLCAAVERVGARAAAERRLTSVVGSVSDVTYEVSLPDGPLAWYGDLRALSGFSPAEFGPDMPAWLARVLPEDQPLIVQAAERAARAGRPYDVSYRLQHRDGGWRVWRDRGRTSMDATGTLRLVGAITDVTAEWASRARYAALNDRLRVAAASLGFGMYEHDYARGRAVFSPEARAMFGVAAGEEVRLDAQGIPEAILPEDLEVARRALTEAVAPGGAGEMACEYRIRRPGGAVRWVQARAKLFFERRGEEQRPSWATGVLFDVTDRREADARLRGRDSRLRQIMRTSPVGIVFARLSGEIVETNDAFLRILGVEPGELDPTALDWRALLVRQEQTHEAILELAATGAIAPIEAALRRRDGSIATILATGVRFDPSVDEHVTFVFDLTPMKQAERRLRASEQQFRLVLEKAPIPILLHTLDGEIVARSRAVEQLTGWTAADTPTGLEWFRKARRLEGAALAAEVDRVRDTLGSIGRMSEEVDVWTKDGRLLRWLYHGSSLIEAGDGQRFITSMALDVTAHRNASEELARVLADLRQTNALLDAIFASAPLGLAFWDRDLRLRRVNPRLAAFNGLSVEAHAGRSPDEVLPGVEDVEGIMTMWRAVIDERRTQTIEVRGSSPSEPGCERIWREHFFPVELAGEVVGGSAVVEEVTARREAEQRLEESERRFRLFADNVDDVLWMARPGDGAILYVSPAYERVWGRRVIDLYDDARDWIEGIHPADRERVERAYLEQAFDEGYDEEYRVVQPDGGMRWVRHRGFPVRDESGRLICAAGISEDITERQHAAVRLEAEEQRYRRIFEQTATSTWELDFSATRARIRELSAPGETDFATRLGTDRNLLTELLTLTRVRSVNPATLRMLGVRSLEELVAQLPGMLTASSWDAFAEAMVDLAEGRSMLEMETCILRLDGSEVHLLARARLPALGEAADQVLLSLLDVTAMKDAEAVLREANQRKDEFLAMLAHELRNPLAPIRNAAEALRLAQSEEPVVRWARDLIERQVQHLAHIVDDLLDVSRIVQGKVVLHRTPLDLGAVVRSAIETNRATIDARGHALVTDLPAEPLPVEGDFVRLAQVVGNLLTNAAKYTPEGGRITVGARREGEHVVLRVRDTGEGIARELLPLVFDLFTQAHRTIDRSQGGLGIGLTVVKRLVEMHGGDVWATSDGPGRGAEFCLRLRLAAMPLQPREANRTPLPFSRITGPVRVLVVDDNADAADSLAELLRLSGYAVRTAPDGTTALVEAETFRPEAALLDLGLPGMDGFELARRLRANPFTADAMLVAVTGYGREEDVRQAHAAGFDHHLVKPVDLAMLRQVLATVG